MSGAARAGGRSRGLAIGLAALALGLLGALVAWAGPARILELLLGLAPGWALASLLALLAGALLGAANAWWLALADRRVAFGDFLAHYWAGWLVGLVVPGQVADSLTLGLLLRREQVPLSESLAGLGLDKLLTLLVYVAALGALPLVLAGILDALAPALVLAGVLLALLLLALAEAPLRRLRERARARWLRAAAATIANASALLRARPWAALANLLLSLVKATLTGFSYWCALRAVGLPLAAADLPAITLCALSAGLVAYLPLSFNGVGTVELTGLVLFGALGHPPGPVLAAYLWLRLAVLLVAGVPVLALLLRGRWHAPRGT